jgi:integrase
MGKLNDIQIKNWIRAGQPVAIADGAGLNFTLSAKGTATWILRYRHGGRARELTIGRYPDITLMKARQIASEARVKLQQGIDVGREQQKQKTEARAAKTMRDLSNDYMEKRFPKLAKTTVKQRRSHIEDRILPRLGSIPAREVTTGDVVDLIDAVGKRSVHVAELVFTALNEIFKHGQARHVVITNPCSGLSVSAICGDPKPTRARLMLTEGELRELLPSLSRLGQQNATIVRLLLLTCVRIGELFKAEWVNVDLDGATWLIPDENSKTGRGFTVPLTEAAVESFRELHELACGSPYVIPARSDRRDDDGQPTFAEQRKVNHAIARLSAALGPSKLRRFTPHDLRSTARSHLASLGVSIVVAERCLNHTLGGLLAVYDQHDYLTERRAALQTWADFLDACNTGRKWSPPDNNVIPMRRVAGVVA